MSAPAPVFPLRVVSWNVLAQGYVRRAYYPHTPDSALEPARRRAAVIARLVDHARDADVVCLQEIERAPFEAAAHALAGFVGRLVLKTGRSEGCAIFARESLAPAWRELVYADRSGHVAIGASLAGGAVSIASTHLKWSPPDTPLTPPPLEPSRHEWMHGPVSAAAARLPPGGEPGSLRVTAASGPHHGHVELVELLDAWVTPGSSWVLTGDFNLEPGDDALRVASARGLRDAYDGSAAAPTCNSNGKAKRIDFVWTTADLAAAPAAVRAIADDTPLPSDDEPSDHLAIGATITRVT